MKLLLAFVPLLISGCAIHGSWLDEIGRPQPPVAISDTQAQHLAQEAWHLRTRAEAIRLRLARETDRRQRFRHYEALRRLDDDLVPLERALMDAGRPARMVAPAAPAAA